MHRAELNFLIDPFLTFKRVKKGYSMLLDSRYQLKDYGNYSIIGFNPKIILKQVNGEIYITEGNKDFKREGAFLDILDYYIDLYKKPKSDLIFDGGFIGYLSYDFGMDLCKIKRKNKALTNIPEAFFAYYDEFIIIDHKNNTTIINTKDFDVVNLLKNIEEEYKIDNNIGDLELTSNFTKEEYKKGVERVREYIRQGEVYQVNISQQFYAKGFINPYDAYAILRRANYGPYNAFLEVDGGFILSTSPEQFIRKRGEYITTRPIKGTTKRSYDKEENEKLKKMLLESEKIKSELLMIIDLERNDLSKICYPGTVEVKNLFEVEEYATVNHLVSTIQGKLLDDIKFSDIIKAMFPGGSITGAPKLRSMEVIEEIENMSRGIYTGSIGYISNNGNFDFNIAIRTVVIDENGLYYNVGGGIVWDSDPEDEYEETLHKGRAIYSTFSTK
ncbi:aminodeoxychorismate synthase component I [Caloramator sp. CAR-1]|uniref:aminodeoxychorismate synthase component I n=1 Tax=Caloramator sp. CAR-1 TaxID=3062777 RepID=UPI0026E31035|nr:aminodeoxychorismate synthase component I [Caloramator sp. CAR-1]MDO6355688.1 aminodeoxychorismate synthase component I [Caloramator sp. CAR-1]